MKKSLIALAVLGLSGAAMAQSSVTLYGVADAGLGQIKAPGGSPIAPGVLKSSDNTSAATGKLGKAQFISASLMNNTDSRLGVRGVEDLGGGLKVKYNFETGLDLDDGSTAGSTFWARQANMAISGDWGTVSLGRQFTPSYLALSTYELTGTANYSVLGNTYHYVGLTQRADSAFAYITPTFSGLTAGVAFVSKNDYLGKNVWDVAALYANGPISAGVSVNKVQNGKTGYQLGGKYSFGDFAVAASYTQAALPATKQVRRGFGLGGSATFGAFTATLDLTRDTKNNWYVADGKKYTNGVVELKYALSKRTFVYGAYLRSDRTNNYGLGIRHNF
ncbi:MAG: porin [Desulfovibrionaceae bacterium]|jgi:predicted porin|nr:porin [Desulfovibrionaceae bacterium]